MYVLLIKFKSFIVNYNRRAEMLFYTHFAFLLFKFKFLVVVCILLCLMGISFYTHVYPQRELCL